MKLLTTEQAVSAAHYVGLVGAAVINIIAFVTAVRGNPWTPPGSLVGLDVACITGAFMGQWLTMPKPGVTSSTTTTSSSSSVKPGE